MPRLDNLFAHAGNLAEGDAQVLWRHGTVQVPRLVVSFPVRSFEEVEDLSLWRL